jgi:tRNA threonylcarbamoyladenosine biosynthesis protein TsaB
MLCTPTEAVARLPRDLALAAGNGAGLLAEAAAGQDRAIDGALPDLQPGAMALAALAAESPDRTEILRPLYLRPPDATPQNTALERRR